MRKRRSGESGLNSKGSLARSVVHLSTKVFSVQLSYKPGTLLREERGVASLTPQDQPKDPLYTKHALSAFPFCLLVEWCLPALLDISSSYLYSKVVLFENPLESLVYIYVI